MRKTAGCFLFALVFAAGCGREKTASRDMNEAELLTFTESAPARYGRAGSPGVIPQGNAAKRNFDESKIIKTAHLEFQVDDIEESKKHIQELVEAGKGYIASQEESNNQLKIQVVFTIRVPSDGFDRLLEGVLKEGIYVGILNIERRDVTEEFLDLKARTETQKALEARYRDILRQAKTVEEILKVESELGKLREEIEAKEGRMKYLSHQAEFSTIHATVYQKLPYKAPPKVEGEGFIDRLADSLVNGWSGFVAFLLALIAIWPLLIILCILYFFVMRLKKSRKYRKDKIGDSK